MFDKKFVAYLNFIGSLDVRELIGKKGAYTHYVFTYWTMERGPSNALRALVNGHFGPVQEVMNALRKAGIQVMVSCGGEGELPISSYSPEDYGKAIGKFARKHGFDGIDFHMRNLSQGLSTAQWLSRATLAARTICPDLTLSHAPQAQYFSPEADLYGRVHEQVGDLIDFYNIQYFDHGETLYDTYRQLFLSAGPKHRGTAIAQLCKTGIPLHKLIIGKPIAHKGYPHSGYVPAEMLAAMLEEAAEQGLAPGGVMGWQWLEDALTGSQWSQIVSAAMYLPLHA